MKHAGAIALDRIEPLLGRLRKLPALKEKSRGVFYRGSRAFLHFHEDGALIFADVRLSDEFERFSATNREQQSALLAAILDALADGNPKPKRSTKGSGR